jgi:hypothetical protein
MMRQIAGALAECEKARLVAKLKHARDRKRENVQIKQTKAEIDDCPNRPCPFGMFSE